MRRLISLVAAVVIVDTMLFAALTPLLPEFSERFHLSKGAAGLLVASYAIGVLAGAVPAGLAATRFGAKEAALSGLLVVGAASVGFAFAGDARALGLARFAQGIGSSLAWAGGLSWLIAAVPRNRRGATLGLTLGAAIFGALLGPVLGGIASITGTRTAFTAVGVIAALVAAVGAREAGVRREAPNLSALRPALRSRGFLAGLWLMLLAALLFGVLAVLASLDLARLGWEPWAIGALFFTAAAVEAVLNPLIGRVVDRRGALAPVRVALPAGIAVALALAWADTPALIVAAALAGSLAWGSLFTPGMALLSRAAEGVGLPQALAFGLMNAAWASGA
ncbi:MAG: MFS transporter, partial [Thermoleophilia bacterium]|nr:MFS transporter [Thermoleophilia bacterium]